MSGIVPPLLNQAPASATGLSEKRPSQNNPGRPGILVAGVFLKRASEVQPM